MVKTKKNDGLSVDWNFAGKYPVSLVDQVFAHGDAVVAGLLREITGVERPRLLLVADANVVQRTEGLGARIGRWVQENGFSLAAPPVVLGGGEKLKSDDFQSVRTIMSAAMDAKVGANDVVLAMGGGSLLDIAGYASSQVRGGIRLVRIPTTPSAMLDSAFAESACVNFMGIKDALHVPSRPDAVIIDFSFMKTVMDGVWRGGLGALVRHAAVRDGALMKKLAKSAEALKNREPATVQELYRAAIESCVKKGRSSLSLWCVPRLEAMSGYKLPYGYAVPIGICIDCAYAVLRGYLKEHDQELICGTLAESGSLEGLAHSRHLLGQSDNLLVGLDAWRLSNGMEAIELPCGVGKGMLEERPDRNVYREVLKQFLAEANEA